MPSRYSKKRYQKGKHNNRRRSANRRPQKDLYISNDHIFWILFIAGILHVITTFNFVYPLIIFFVFMGSEFFSGSKYRWKVFFYTTAIYGLVAWISTLLF
jgi:hypothetical protein